MSLPPLPTVTDIHERLQIVFPEGTANRNYVTREIAAKTVFVMLYIGAVKGAERWLRPDQVTRMTDAQAMMESDPDREAWLVESMRPTAGYIEGRWYATNTREPIRDDRLAQDIGLTIQPDRNLPDLILVDLGPVEPLLTFVEVVATAGPVSEARQAALMAIATEAGFSESQVAFLIAYADRDDAAFKTSVSKLAWRSFAWFMSEPEHIVVLQGGPDTKQVRLSELMRVWLGDGG